MLWINRVKNSFFPLSKIVLPTMDHIIAEANDLFICLQKRMYIHLLKIKEKASHWVWSFARNNLHRCCAIIVMTGYVRKDPLHFLGRHNVCLFEQPALDPEKFDKMLLMDVDCQYTELAKEYEGVYNIFEKEGCTWV